MRAGYGKELESRLGLMEEVLKTHAVALRNLGVDPDRLASDPTYQPSLASSHGVKAESNGLQRASEASESQIGQQNSAFTAQRSLGFSPGQQADFAMQRPPTEHYQVPSIPNISQPTNNPPIIPQQPFNGVPRTNPSPATHWSPAETQTHVSNPIDNDFPPFEICYALVDLYFTHINTWCPILQKEATMNSLLNQQELPAADKNLLHAIIATSMRYSTDPWLTQDRRTFFHKVSSEKVQLYGMANASVRSLQALVILALDICGNGNGHPAWSIMAVIARTVIHMGLAIETNSFMVSPAVDSIYTLRTAFLEEPKDFVEDESRRRLFWAIYLLDRYATISTAFEFALPDKEIDRFLPCHDDFWNRNQKVDTRWFKIPEHEGMVYDREADKPENLGAFSYYVEILGILTKIHKFLKEPIDIRSLPDVEKWQRRYKELDNTLDNWHYELPPTYRNLATVLKQGNNREKPLMIMLQATYYTAVIRLHSSAGYPPIRSRIFTSSHIAARTCYNAVENIARIGEYVVQNDLLSKLGMPFAFTLWVCARLLLVHGSSVERELSPRLPFFVETLREMGKYWPIAARYCNLLQRVLDEHRATEGGVMANTVRILTDMRRTAFDLDVLISRQPRLSSQQVIPLQTDTPVRTPGQDQFMALNMFAFFNVPRLPVGADNNAMGQPDMDMQATANFVANPYGPDHEMNNISNFMMDANSDWLLRQEAAQGQA